MKITPYLLSDDGAIPNNSLPLLVYSKAFEFGSMNRTQTIERFFSSHGWSGLWRNGIYAFQHYHSTTHEVLACSCGKAKVLLGGEKGILLSVRTGDVLLIPAGVGHFNKGSTSDFAVVGGYPPGYSCDMCYGDADERPSKLKNIAALPLPAEDPVLGRAGGLKEYWTKLNIDG